MNWTPGTPGYPLVVVEGSATLSFNSGSMLSEATVGVNLNPVGTPYGGVTDSDTADSYPSEMRGLIWVTGNLTTSTSPKVVGCVVIGGALTTSGTLTLQYDPAIAASPPPGFTGTATLTIIPGTWQQVVE
jgi:hypothetical protein